MKVFVTGATGAIGSHAVLALVRAGHHVTALARTPEKAEAVRAAGADAVTISLFDRAALAAAFAGHDAVVNLASALPPSARFMREDAWTENKRIRSEGSTAVVDAAIAAGIQRVIQESVCMIYRDQGDAWIDEASPTDDFPIARTNHAAEANCRRFTSSGGIGITLRFGWFYGPSATHSQELFALAKNGLCIMMGHPDGYVSSIHMIDAGAAVEAALSVPAGAYNIVDDEPLTKREYADALAAAAGRRFYIRLPGRMANLFGDRTTSLTRSLRVSNRRFREISGWAPTHPSAREGWRARHPH